MKSNRAGKSHRSRGLRPKPSSSVRKQCPVCLGDRGHSGLWEYGSTLWWFPCTKCGGLGYLENGKN